MTIRPFKYLLQPVAVEQDDETGRLLRELPAEPVTVYNGEQALKAIEEFEMQLGLVAPVEAESETR